MANLNIKLVKSLNGRLEKQVATAHSLGPRTLGHVTLQPATDPTRRPTAQLAPLLPATHRQ